jgi:Domain of unknown function (DUF4138)
MKTVLGIVLWMLTIPVYSQTCIKKNQIKFKLYGVFIKGDTLSFETALFNRSLIGYEPQYIRFFIRDRHIVTRTAVQERELNPLTPVGRFQIQARSSTDLIFDFHPFTIPETKELVISIKERNGSRDLMLHISGGRLLRMIQKKTETELSQN